jgi:hypothetical protein
MFFIRSIFSCITAYLASSSAKVSPLNVKFVSVKDGDLEKEQNLNRPIYSPTDTALWF